VSTRIPDLLARAPVLLLVLLPVLSPARGGAQESVPADAAQAQAVGADGLRLGPGDAVRLELFPERGALPPGRFETAARPMQLLQTPERLEYEVDSSGQVLLPVAGVVQVSGRTFAEVRREVEQAFHAEFAGALVRLIPLLRIGVLGEVRTPGLLPVDPTMTLSDVLAAAGGLTDLANPDDIRLVRRGETLTVTSAEDMVEVRTPLASGDRVVVGRRSWASRNEPFLIGALTSLVASVLTALLVR
jgi:protein involved in polysaccharide export with SLBB domain